MRIRQPSYCDVGENKTKYAGCVVIHRRSGGIWIKDAVLKAPIPVFGGHFGESISYSRYNLFQNLLRKIVHESNINTQSFLISINTNLGHYSIVLIN